MCIVVNVNNISLFFKDTFILISFYRFTHSASNMFHSCIMSIQKEKNSQKPVAERTKVKKKPHVFNRL